MSEVTRILYAIEQGDVSASDKLLPLVYRELRNLAEAKLRHEPNAHSLQPTVLVHEAYVRLVDIKKEQEWSGKNHFFGAAAEAMRRILIERARQKGSQKRGGDWQRVPFDNVDPESAPLETELLDLDEALKDLEEQWPQHANLVKLRYFAGLTVVEAAQVINVSRATADRQWSFAKAWLYDRLNSSDSKI